MKRLQLPPILLLLAGLSLVTLLGASGAAAAQESRLLFFTGGLKPLGEPAPSELVPGISLSGSRGEILDFMLRARPEEPGRCFSLSLSPLRSKPLSASQMARTTRIDLVTYEALPFKTEHPSYLGARVGDYLDPLIPGPRICPQGDATWVLGEISIPEDLPPGRYEGSVTGLGEIPLKLRVWDRVIPEKPTLPLYSELTTYFLLLGHYGKWHAGEEDLARQYIREMLAHRIVPYKQWVSPIPFQAGVMRLREPESVSPPESPDDSFFSTVVKPLPEWSYLSVPLPERGSADTGRYLSALRVSLSGENWLHRAFAYLWDEPEPKDFPALKKLGRLVREEAPGLRTLVTTEYRKDLSGIVDIFVPIMNVFAYPGHPAPEVYEKWRERPGKEFWLYVSCMSHGCTNDVDAGTPDWVIDRPGTYIRSQAWIASLYHANALLYYSVDNGFQAFAHGRDPWMSLWDFTGNGDGTLFYPGRPGLHGLTREEPIESLRLKLWRQASYDAEYVHWMDSLRVKPKWWPKLLHSLVRSPRDWERSNSAYEEARRRMGEYLSEHAR